MRQFKRHSIVTDSFPPPNAILKPKLIYFFPRSPNHQSITTRATIPHWLVTTYIHILIPIPLFLLPHRLRVPVFVGDDPEVHCSFPSASLPSLVPPQHS